MRHMRFNEQSRIATLFDHAAEHMPEHGIEIASASPVLGDARRLSNADAATLVDELSGWFPAAGVEPGARVVIAKQNHPDIVFLAAAASRAGHLPANVSAAVPAEQARVVLDRVHPDAVVADRGVIDAWGLGAGDPWKIISVDDDGTEATGATGATGRTKGNGGTKGNRIIPAASLRGAPAATPNPPAHDEPMVVTHTSGTTGVPKLVVHSADTVRARSRVVTWPIPVLSLRRRDRFAAYLPWGHARSIEYFTAGLHTGHRMLAISDPDPVAVTRALESFRPTVLESVPNVFLLWEGIADHARRLFSKVRLYLNAFDAMHPRTVRAFLMAAPRRALWLQGYGQSEVGVITVAAYTRRTVRPREDRPPTLRDMGWASRPMSRIRVTDPDTAEPVGPNTVGQLEVHSGGRVLTYLGQEHLHLRRVRGKRGEWWTTGDLGYMTRTGRTMLNDREIDAIPGVESCLEIEDRLLDALPETSEVALLNVDGKAVPVVCTLDDAPLDRDRWNAAVHRHGGSGLGDPVHLAWDTVPRTGTYKVRRHALVDRLREGDLPVIPPAGATTAGNGKAGNGSGTRRPVAAKS